MSKYFSAYAKWKPDSYRRYQKYVAALKAHNVQFFEGRFKQKHVCCRQCGNIYETHEEKETDVNIGAHLMADAINNRFDRALIVSADTDLNEAVKLARQESDKQIDIVAPPGRTNFNRESLFAITVGRIRRSLLPESITYDSEKILRPKEYDPPET